MRGERRKQETRPRCVLCKSSGQSANVAVIRAPKTFISRRLYKPMVIKGNVAVARSSIHLSSPEALVKLTSRLIYSFSCIYAGHPLAHALTPRGPTTTCKTKQEGRAVDVQSAQPTLEGTTRASDDDVLGKIGAEEDDVDTPPKNELFPMSEEEGKSRDESTIEVVTRSLSRDHAGREGDTFIVDDDVDLGDLHVATEISVNGERDNVDKRYEYGSKSVDDLDGDVSDVTGTLARAKAGVDENGDSNDTEGQEYPGNGDNRVTESIEAEEFTEEATELAQWGERRGEDTSRAMDPNGAGLDNQSNKENAPLGADGFDSNSDSANDVQRTTGDKHQDRGQKLLAATEEDTRENSGTGARDAGILVTDAVKEEGNYESTAVNKTIPVDQEKGTGAARVDASHQSDRGNKMREAGRQQQQREEEEEERQDAGTLPIAVLDWTSTDSYETNSPSLAIGEHSAGNSDSPLGSPHAPPDVVEKDGVNTTQDTMRSVAAETINNSKSVREVPWATDSCALREGVQVMTEELACH